MKIYVIGDSISIQYGPHLESDLRGVMTYSRKEGNEEALLNLDYPLGANAGDSGMVLSFLEAKQSSDEIDADYLLLNCGLHDIKVDPQTQERQVPINQYRKNLEAIVTLVDKLECQLIWIRSTPVVDETHNQPGFPFFRYSEDLHAYNRAADKVMTSAGIPVIDLFTITSNLSGELYCDHVHFNEQVRQQQAAFITGWLMAYTSVQ
jgi:lysophospholipase L1-like esterase